MPLDELPVVLLFWMLVDDELELEPLLRVEVPLFILPWRKLLFALLLLLPTPLFKFDEVPSMRVSETT